MTESHIGWDDSADAAPPLDDETATERIFRLQIELHDSREQLLARTPRPLRWLVRWLADR
jgi:hypothetical protein